MRRFSRSRRRGGRRRMSMRRGRRGSRGSRGTRALTIGYRM